MTTTTSARAALDNGTARLRYIKMEEAWWAAANNISLPRWSVGVDLGATRADHDGTFGEWEITFRDGCATHVFADDSLAAAAAVHGYLEALADQVIPAQVERALVGLGFRDETPREQPDRPAAGHRYRDMTIAEIVDEFAVERGDLSEEYSRTQLVRILEDRITDAAGGA